MKIYYTTLVIIGLLALSSCFKDNDSDECDPNKVCYTDAPPTLYVRLHLSPSPDGSTVTVRLYEGNVDDGELYDTFETSDVEETYLLPVDQYYSAEAEYTDGATTIIAVDGERLNQESFQNCDETCYDWEHSITLDLELAE